MNGKLHPMKINFMFSFSNVTAIVSLMALMATRFVAAGADNPTEPVVGEAVP